MNSFFLRRAVLEDCDLIFNWANDDLVRQNSFSSQKINYEDHLKWFNSKIVSNKCNIYMFCNNKDSIGIVRVEIENRKAVISYSLDKNFRGMGLSNKMLRLLENKLIKEKIEIKELIGFVKFDNLTSQKIFEKLGYTKYNESDCVKYIKYIK